MSERTTSYLPSRSDWGWLIAVPGVVLAFAIVYMHLPPDSVDLRTFAIAAVLLTLLVGLLATIEPMEWALNRLGVLKTQRWVLGGLLIYILISVAFDVQSIVVSTVFLLSQLFIFAAAVAETQGIRSARK